MNKLKRKNKSDKIAEEIVKEIKSPLRKESKNKILIPSGSTLLNLACSDNYEGAFVAGTIVNLIGDTSAGKSFLALTILAEICNNKSFDGYDLYYDDVEKSLEFNLEKLFGKNFIKRVKLNYSTYAEEVAENLFGLTVGKKIKPFISIIDSWDALKSKYEENKEKINIGKRKRGQEEEGSFGDGKAKLLHKICRQSITGIEKTNSLLIIVSQTKDNWGFDARFNPKIVTGGNAIKFFPSHRVWLTIISKIPVKKIDIGIWTRIKVIKNKFTGKRRNIDIPIYDDYGIDDLTSCVKFLNSESGRERWKTKTREIDGKSITAIDATELDVFLKEKSLVRYIEDNSFENELRQIVANAWKEIEDSVLLNRKSKY